MRKLALALGVLFFLAPNLLAQSNCTEKLPAAGNIGPDTVTGINVVTEIAADGTVVQDQSSSPFSFVNSWGGPGDTAHAAGITGQTETDAFKVCSPSVPYGVSSQRSYSDPYHTFTVGANVASGVVTMTTTSHMSLAEGYVLTFACTYVTGCTFQEFQNDYTVTLSYSVDTGSYTLSDSTTAVYSFVAPDQSTWHITATSTYQHSGTWPQVTGGTPPLQITTSILQPGSATVHIAYNSQPLSATGGTPFPPVSYSYPYSWSGTMLPVGLGISYFTGEVYGLPAVAGSFFPTITVKDFAGVTTSKAFVLAVSSAKSRYTDQEKAYFALLAADLKMRSEALGIISTACDAAALEDPLLEPICIVANDFGNLDTLFATINELKAADPPDSNYTVIPQPSTLSISMPDPHPSWTSAQLAAYTSMRNLIFTLERLIGLGQAEIMCVNRADGAFEAGNAFWEAQQVSALKRYSKLEAFYLQLLILQEAQLAKAYSKSGFPDFAIDVTKATEFELGVAANGLDSDFKQELLALGADASELTLLAKAWSSFDPNAVSGDIVQKFAPDTVTTIAIQQLVSSTIRPFSHLSARAEARPATGTFQVLVSFTLGSESDGSNPNTEDVSFSLGPLGVTVPAGSFRRNSKGFWQFTGVVNGIGLAALIKQTSTGYSLQVDGTSANLIAVVNPMTVLVQIGNDGGATTIAGELK